MLENINRPDVPWDEYKQYILDTKQKHPNFTFEIEIIMGLPGQTLKSFSENLIEYISLRPIKVLGHIWVMLINSPGYNVDYREKFGIKVEPALHITKIPSHLKTREDILKSIDLCEYYAADTVIATNTATTADIMGMLGMLTLYNEVSQKNKVIDFKLINKVLSNIEYWHNFGTSVSKLLETDLTQYGKILLLPDLHGTPVTFTNYFSDKHTLLNILKSAYQS